MTKLKNTAKLPSWGIERPGELTVNSGYFWLLYKTRGLNDFAKCAYEAEMGTNLATSKLILKNLKSSQWLDTETDSVFFEQTYYNGNINSFLMFRISWEHVDGGMFQGKKVSSLISTSNLISRSTTNQTTSLPKCKRFKSSVLLLYRFPSQFYYWIYIPDQKVCGWPEKLVDSIRFNLFVFWCNDHTLLGHDYN